MSQPPSFEPRKNRRRPSAEGAQEVGGRSRSDATPRTPPRSVSNDDARRPNGPVRRSAFTDHVQENQPIDATRTYRVSDGTPPSYPPASYPPQAQKRPAPVATEIQQPIPTPAAGARKAPKPKKKRSFGKRLVVTLLVLSFATGGWVAYLYSYGNARLNQTDALSGAANTPGTTYLIVGSDKRGEAVSDPTEGQRADTIMLLHKPVSGRAALVSLPRDTLVNYPDTDNRGKLNGTYNYGASYLVLTVESLTGLTIDHYIEIGMDGVQNLTDAVGGVELCLDYDVSDQMSGLEWTAGCAQVDGATALAFSRMRYSDPLGDIGRTARQRQVVGKIIDKALSPGILLNPLNQYRLVGDVADVLTVHTGGSLMTVARAGLALREVMGSDGLTGTPPIASLNYPGPGGSSTVLLAPEAEQFWLDLRDGSLTQESFASF